MIKKLDLNMKPTYDTSARAKIPSHFIRKYEIPESTTNDFFIHHFWDMAWNNPFPEDENSGKALDACTHTLKHKFDELVYDSSRYMEEYSPLVVYLPDKWLMLKLMRACINCKTHKELWINSTIEYLFNEL